MRVHSILCGSIMYKSSVSQACQEGNCQNVCLWGALWGSLHKLVHSFPPHAAMPPVGYMFFIWGFGLFINCCIKIV